MRASAGSDVLAHVLPLCLRRLYLRNENPVIPLGLIELRRGGGALREQPPGSFVIAPRDSALNLEHVDVLGCFAESRANSFALREHLLNLERGLRAVDQTNGRIGRESHSLDGSEPLQLPARLGGNDNFFRLEVSIGIRLFLTSASGGECREQQ